MGNSQYDFLDVKYHHIVLEGSQYEVGKRLAGFLAREPDARKRYGSAKTDLKRLGFADFKALWEHCEECCPGVTDEIQGFADGLGIATDELPFWNWTFAPALGGECSQVALLSPVTKDHHIYVGRSYEWNHNDEDLKLFTTRIRGKANHIGFSCLLFGRHDGLNEHGLVVSMTGGGIFRVPFKHRGPMFWLPIRSLLDRCKSVEDALDHLATLPLTGYCTLMFVDGHDNAAFVEVADGVQCVKSIAADDEMPFGFSVNHFRFPDTQAYNRLNCGIITNSRLRESLITNWCTVHSPAVTKEQIRRLFAAEHPKGLCNHFYNDGFGTLWSMIFDLTRGSLDVCFSAPTHNKYHAFDLNAPVGMVEYPVVVPVKKSRL